MAFTIFGFCLSIKRVVLATKVVFAAFKNISIMASLSIVFLGLFLFFFHASDDVDGDVDAADVYNFFVCFIFHLFLRVVAQQTAEYTNN